MDKPVIPASVGFSSLQWDARSQQYYLPSDTSGTVRYLTGEAVRRAIFEDIAEQEDTMHAVGVDLVEAGARYEAGEISRREFIEAIEDWRDSMAEAIKVTHLNYSAAARGGFHNMTAEHYGRVGGLLPFHYEKLDNFAHEILNDPAILRNGSPGKMGFDERTSLYARTGWFTYQRELLHSHQQAGYDEYRRISQSDEPCEDEGAKIGCSTIIAQGWGPIGSYPDIGKGCPCGPACKCHWEFRRSAEAQRKAA